MAALRASIEGHCVLCEVRAHCQEITAIREFGTVFVCFCKNDDLHVLNQLPVNVTFYLCTRLDTRKDQ